MTTKAVYSLLNDLYLWHSMTFWKFCFPKKISMIEKGLRYCNNLFNVHPSVEGHLEFNRINLADMFNFRRDLCSCASQYGSWQAKSSDPASFTQECSPLSCDSSWKLPADAGGWDEEMVGWNVLSQDSRREQSSLFSRLSQPSLWAPLPNLWIR